MRAVKRNMRDQILTSDRKILRCPSCGAEYSGNSGDYWDLPNDFVVKCEDCDVEMKLIDKVVTVKYI